MRVTVIHLLIASVLEVTHVTISSEHDQNSISPEGEDHFLRIKRSYLYAAFLPLAFVAGLASGFLIWGRNPAPEKLAAQVDINSAAVPTEPQQPRRFEVSEDDDPSIGPEDAAIVIVEFSDFNCPYCLRFHQETFTDLMNAYEGQIRFVYRDFPVVGGGQVGLEAAQAANCAAEQIDYWAYHDALFSRRYNLDREGFEQYAIELGLDEADFTQCLDNERYLDEVGADLQYGAGLGITGTPTFFINGLPLVGAQPLSNFTQLIDDELEDSLP